MDKKNIKEVDESQTAVWYNYDLSNELKYTRCIKHLQKMIRGSMSYDVWQKRSKFGVHKCPICGSDLDIIKPESHHYPKTLFEIVDDYLQYLINENKLDDYSDFDVVEEIMLMHIQKRVDYIVLCEYCHKKYHDDVPEVIDVIDQKWKEQTEERKKYLK